MTTPPPAGNPYPTPGAALAAAPPSPTQVNWRRGALLGGVITFIAACGLAVLIYVGLRIGVVALSVGMAAAVLPVPLLVYCFLWLDRYEPEPTLVLVIIFFWGACVATAAALAVNTLATKLVTANGLPDSLVAVLVAPFIEESMKALGPVLLFIIWRRSFSGLFAGIVYRGLSPTGFAMVENILYLGGYGYYQGAKESPLNGAAAVVTIFIVRIVMTGFAHPLFTSMTGLGLGVAARAADRRVRWLAPVAGLL